MKILETRDLGLPGVKVVRYARFRDERGYFTETFRREEMSEALGGEIEVVQQNESRSAADVVRGLHLQWNPWQGKLVRAIEGRLIDVALDVRRGSPTFGQAVALEMPARPGDDDCVWIWLPPGFAHGAFFTETTTIQYLCTGAWSPGCEASISPAAPDIDWSPCDPALREEIRALLDGGARLSEKDRDGMSLAEWRESEAASRFVHAPGAPWSIRSDA